MILKPPPLQGVRTWGDLALALLFVAFMFAVLMLAVTQ